MIPTKINNLFSFIDFLHSNIEHYRQYNVRVKQIFELVTLRNKHQGNNYYDQVKYKKLDNEIKNKRDEYQSEITSIIKAKGKEYEVFIDDQQKKVYCYDDDIVQLKENTEPKDLYIIIEYESKYLEFRNGTNKWDFFDLDMHFRDLDEIAIDIFKYYSKDKRKLNTLRIKPYNQNNDNLFWLDFNFYKYVKYDTSLLTTKNYAFTTIINDEDQNGNSIKYQILNPFIHEIIIVGFNTHPDKSLKIEVENVKAISKKDKTTLSQIEIENFKKQTDEPSQKEISRHLLECFKKGHKEGLNYFKKDLEPTYKQMYILNPDNLKKVFIDDLFYNEYGLQTQKITLDQYKRNKPILFNHVNFYKDGYLNGILHSFIDFIKDKTILKKEVEAFDKKEYLKENYKPDNHKKENKKEKLNFDPKQFNKKGVKLFEYLIENYAELTKTRGLKKKLSNLWHFMKNDNSKKDSYKFYFTKDEYKAYILKEYKIKITNTDKSPNKYAESDLPQLKNHVIQFEDLKKTE
jgi:hypothetical protein